MSEVVEIKSMDDAKNFVNSSTVAAWPWGGSASADGFAEYLLANHGQVDKEDFSAELKAYLTSAGEDPGEYGLF